MSIITQFWALACDSCERYVGGFETTKDALAHAESHGWKWVAGKVYCCKKCLPKKAKRAERKD